VRLDLHASGHLPDTAVAATLTFTATDAVNPGFVTAWPCDTPMPLASSVNAQPGLPRPNTVTIPLAVDGSVCAVASTSLAMVVDLVGWWEPRGSPIRLEPPARAWDTRPEGVRLPAGREIAFPVTHAVDAGTRAALVNVAVTEGQAPGFLTVWPCGTPRPHVSVANWVPGSTSADNALAIVDTAGRVCMFASTDVHVVVDVVGWLDP
jgi:hypothetical protein